MATFTVQEVKEATKAQVLMAPKSRLEVFQHVDTDTRTLTQQSLFVALTGDRFNGHDFVLEAVKKGATGIVVSENRPEYRSLDAIVFLVADTLQAYQQLAQFHRRRFSIPVIAVTGSVGKTSTRNIIASVLSQKFNVCQTEKNFNNEIGLPKTLLQLDKTHEVCVVEMGMRGLGQIAALASIAEPTVGVVTNVGKSHIELLGSIENIARAKAELVEALSEEGIAILNQDDSRVAAMSNVCKGKVIGYGVSCEAAVQAERIRVSEKGVSFMCRCFDQGFEVKIPVLGKHHVYNALAAIATGRLLGLSENQMIRGLSEYKGVPMREELIHIDSYTFINDAYNANPASMMAAIQTLSMLPRGKKIAVLGGMLELGEWSVSEHEALGAAVVQANIDVLITLGELAAASARAARKAGMTAVYEVKTHQEAASKIKEHLSPGAIILLKGSRGFSMEKVLAYFEGM
ncbi:UDP-N-acetylmuramoyl-tripeptide--D-alanyl-D-alanine ligase [Veillonellaceae bacterium M2-8]|nr:UDP-N-acetylmuramoyl-tripeptide--D-alanyl-D-alanine ligase [Veillonellaceae bacterium M2-8]